MQTDSSARRTYFASASASECTTTVLMPSSRQARWMRSAISPRLAIRILSNNWPGVLVGTGLAVKKALTCARVAEYPAPFGSADDHQWLPVLDRLAVLDKDCLYHTGLIGFDLVHELHRLDDA